MKAKYIFTGLVISFSICVLTAVQSCNNSNDEGTDQGNSDTVQTRTDDHTMSKQQHDGLTNPDTTATVDSSGMQ